ncbi:hypothetical protein MP638_005787 [Amoeboaphelidium occidentale]|nr:hypothetical protein MP638_005787 [Amoeboaphelidium occidentale]
MSARTKIIKPAGVEPTELELQVAQAMLDLENNAPDMKADLRPLQISAVKEFDIGHGRKSVVVFVPVPLLKQFHKIQNRLAIYELHVLISRFVRELEKKFSESHVLIVAQRKILPKPTRKSRVKQKRPRSRTLTAVHDSILEDMVYPTEIVGKRTRVAVGGSKLIKVFLDSKDKNVLEYKLGTFTSVYKKITGKDVVFEFPVVASE